ncbi:hypothetical protein QL992_16140 [Microbacterium sp. APC 3898]|uniref:Lipoprotein n=1 Tax=Planococcus notacanthi TaxID=3035188 RepID=A0ABT7ZEX4_9BACL|nr:MULTISPECIES: hypothetical protein [Terrabacteria group]MDN3425700.1 hypothetical protein [Planococcus sp. APC 4016]MDN3500752.1 hypothetical protein [Microbacterium sp. APC 3898]
MKKNLFLSVFLIFLSLMVVGCASNEVENEELEGNEKSSIVEEAINQGKLALADNNLEKAKSNFNLALLEDSRNELAKQWKGIIEEYEKFVSAVDEQEIDVAQEILSELKKNDKYTLFEEIIKEPEENLNILKQNINNLNHKITALNDLYNPEDENSMPSEDYLYFINEILTDPNVTEEQKKSVKEFEEKATERANNILAKMEEEMRAAEEKTVEVSQEESSINGITAYEASNLAIRLPSYSDFVANGDTFSKPRIYEGSWIIDISRPNGLAEGFIIVDENRTVSFMYPNGDVDEVTPY